MIPPDLTIIIPTYKEEKTIKKAIHKITNMMFRTTIPFEILIVDDSSPDKTGEIVGNIIFQKYPVRLITRAINPGLSQSVVEGFKDARGAIIVVVDADLSHDILLIPEMYHEIKNNGADLVIGSRYMKTGGIKNWPIKRQVISFGATFLARLLFPDITDPVSGFFAVKKDLVTHAPLEPHGYKILFEILGKSYWKTYKEIPYTFTNRSEGMSKLGLKTIVEYAQQVFDIARFPGRAWDEVRKMERFAVVGISGIFINMIILAALKEWFRFPLIGASFIAVEMSIFSNFILNDRWTFKEHQSARPWIHRFFVFNGVSIGGMIINIAVLGLLVLSGINYLIGNLIGIFVAFAWNFTMNRKMTWGKN